MSRYKAYSDYRDSGVDWLGEAPSHWATIPVGRLYQRTKRTNFAEKELLSVYRDHGVVPTSSRDDNNNKPSEDLTAYQLVEPDNLVMNKMKAWQGSIAISEHEGIVSPAYFVYQPNARMFDLAIPKYIHYLLRHPMYIAQYLRQSKGIRVNQWDLDPDEFKKIELLLPKTDEQKTIIDFLDHETAKIDALIEKQQRLIELLKEKRQAVISHAVTKGLNPNAPMKDSGVEWLGEVPAHWSISQIRRLVQVRGGFAFNSDLFSEEGIPVIRIGDIKTDGRISLDACKRIYAVDRGYLQYAVRRGDLLMAMTGATIGKAGWYLSDELAYLNQRVGVFKPLNESLLMTYLWYILSSSGYQAYIKLTAFGGAQPNISDTGMVAYYSATPSLSEQGKIVAYLDVVTKKLDDLCRKAESQIALMQERRTALISAAVTGKIDVRDWQAAA
jgi:type I restriction enzyme S subunit